jgi:hypothetical protein
MSFALSFSGRFSLPGFKDIGRKEAGTKGVLHSKSVKNKSRLIIN